MTISIIKRLDVVVVFEKVNKKHHSVATKLYLGMDTDNHVAPSIAFVY